MVNRVNLSLCLIVTQCLVFWFILPKFSKLFRAIHSNYDMLIAGWWEVGLRNRGICNIRYHDVSSSGSPFCSVGCCWVLKWTEIFLHTNTQGNLLGCWLKVVVLIVNRYVKPPIFTLCVGNAWGEAALLLAAGSKGNRACLPSATIMIKQVLHQRTLSPIDLDSQLICQRFFLHVFLTCEDCIISVVPLSILAVAFCLIYYICLIWKCMLDWRIISIFFVLVFEVSLNSFSCKL